MISSAEPSAHETRRWRIGIAITVAFGLFGAVMAYLNYNAKQRPAAPGVTREIRPAEPAAVTPADPSPRGNGKGRRP